MAELRVQQKIMMGLLDECLAITAGSLPHISIRLGRFVTFPLSNLLGLTGLIKGKVIATALIPVNELLQFHRPKFLTELFFLSR